ncbi:MAG: HpcH/HpaI aldolase/citrate lyase family protein [Deferribacterales bacterium]|nr:HpcH/HpaI aldolase/citrate lyase family protein [Deferribacterales bacterium]
MNITERDIEKYKVGPLLYSSALRMKIADDIAKGVFSDKCSIALCLEDTVSDSAVDKAIDSLVHIAEKIFIASCNSEKLLPYIFIRVREPNQLKMIFNKIKPYINIIKGFILPKYSLKNADLYNSNFIEICNMTDCQLYAMPILESADLLDISVRHISLGKLKLKIDEIRQYILNIRVGGNDLCSVLGVRRHADETIYDILPVAQCVSDVLSVFSKEYVLSGPVWEYYSGNESDWKSGLEKELKQDVLNGFIGKTIIHPNQIEVVKQSLAVDKKDYEDARLILSWSEKNDMLVGRSTAGERMNETKTHSNWAKRIIILSSIYGVK